MIRKLRSVRGLAGAGAGFARALVGVADRLGIDPDHLSSAIAFETGGTFSPKIPNAAGSGATGLIQFTEESAQRLGTSAAALAQMSAIAQLAYVERYLRPFGVGKLKSIGDVYLAIFAPAGIGKASGFALYFSPTKKYTQNAALDADGDGKISVREATAPVRAIYDAAADRAPIEVDDGILVDPFGSSPSLGQLLPSGGTGPASPAPMPDVHEPMGDPSFGLREVPTSPEILTVAAATTAPTVAAPAPATPAASWPWVVLDVLGVGALAGGAYTKTIPWSAAVAAIVAICAGRTAASSSGVVGALAAIPRIFGIGGKP